VRRSSNRKTRRPALPRRLTVVCASCVRRCKRFKFETYTDTGRSIQDTVGEFYACTVDRVQCKKSEIACLGTCSGVDGSEYHHDFATIVSLTELSEFVLGDAFETSAPANCITKNAIIEVETFAGGDSFKTYAARIRGRSGLTAISSAWCNDNAASCSVVQRVLERSPGLVFVNGAFRHAYSTVGPSPPPPPLPPPRLFAYAPRPPNPPPPPGTPPPYYQDAEACIPLPRLADYGLDAAVDAVNGAVQEERASCLFVRRVLEERRRASSCFSHIAYPYPPPPAPKLTSDASVAQSQLTLRERLGDLEQYTQPRRTDSAQWGVDTTGAIEGTEALLDALGESNPILQDLLATAMDEIRSAGTGRRLMQRKEYNTRMTDVLITHEIMTFYGKGGIPGVTYGSCEALCEATKQDGRAMQSDQCSMLMRFKPSTIRMNVVKNTRLLLFVYRCPGLQEGGSVQLHRPDGMVLPTAECRGLQSRRSRC